MKNRIQKVFILAAAVLLLTACSEEVVNAGYNTLLGMGMAFAVLIVISLVISLFPMLGKMQGGKDKKTAEQAMRIQSISNTISRIEQQESVESTDDGELIAVISAAIAAYEAETGNQTNGGYRVRQIRRLSGNHWKRA